MPEQRFALIIANSEYEDAKLRPLPSAVQDSKDLERVLGNPILGGFEVKPLLNQPAHEVARTIEDFVADRQLDDLLLIHFSGHGLKDADGKLYFAAANTRTGRLVSTAIPANTINELLLASRSRRKVLILDCCYGGAFLRGVIPRADNKVGVTERFSEGRGLVVITASDALQYAYEGEVVKGKVTSSVFTNILVEGIETGRADKDGDGFIGITELYQYINDHISEKRPEQKPEINNFRLQGEIFIAKSRNLSLQLPLTWEQAQNGGLKTISVAGREETITMPAGVSDGQVQLFKGLGLLGEASAPNGDLLVTYKVAPPPANVIEAQRRRYQRILISVVSITLFGAFLLYSALSFRYTWEPQEVTSHWPSGESGLVTFHVMSDEKSLFTGLFWGKPYARLWDAKTGELLYSVMGSDFRLGPNNVLLVSADDEKSVSVIDLNTKQKYVTPFPYMEVIHNVYFGTSGKAIMHVNEEDGSEDSVYSIATVKVWSLESEKEIGKVTGIKLGNEHRFELYEDSNRLIALSRSVKGLAPALWDIQTGRFISFLSSHANSDDIAFEVDEKRSVIASVEKLSDTKNRVILWDLLGGKQIKEHELPRKAEYKPRKSSYTVGGLSFSPDGSLLFYGGGRTEPYPISILNTSDLLPSNNLPPLDLGWWIASGNDPHHSLLLCNTSPDAYLWNFAQSKQTSLKGFDALNVDWVLISRDGAQAVVLRNTKQVELWDLNQGIKALDLSLSGKAKYVGESIGGSTFYIKLENGTLLLYSFGTAKEIAQIVGSTLGESYQIFFDPECHRINAWVQDGRVLQFMEQAQVFGRQVWAGRSCIESH